MKNQKKLGAIILAAGKGTRMKSRKLNKVVLQLAGKPLILHAVHLLEKMQIEQIIVVIGYAKDSVKKVLMDSRVKFVEQKKRLGTAHAVGVSLSALDSNITDVLILQGDDSHFYDKDLITKLVNIHTKKNSSLTFLTILAKSNFGLGRVVRDSSGNVISIIEEKDADLNVKKINEVNPACYIFNIKFLKKYIKEIPRSDVTGEYYLTSFIDIAVQNKESVETLQAGRVVWRGVNTKEELLAAEKLHNSL